MPIVNKDEILYSWLIAGFETAYPTTFEFLQMFEHQRAVVPMSDVRAVRPYINGDAVKQYDFMLQLAFSVSDDIGSTKNIDNMFAARKWQAWIDEQQQLGNYPDFGEKCSQYKLENLSNMPTMAGRQEDGMAKYQFPARLTYLEVR